MLEMVVAPARADKSPPIRFELTDDITRIFTHRTPQLRPKVAYISSVRKIADDVAT
jgi:hypothetical protein